MIFSISPSHGALIDVLLSPVVSTGDTLRLASTQVTALIDTGASTTAVNKSIVKSMGLLSTGRVLVHTPANADYFKTYPLRLNIPALRFDTSISINAMPLERYSCILGRDVLKHGRFLYDGAQQQFTLELASP